MTEHSRKQGDLFGKLINLAGRQRMLSQRIILHILLAQKGETSALTTANSDLQLFQKTHQRLTKRQEHELQLDSKKIDEIYFGSSGNDNKIKYFITLAKSAIRNMEYGVDCTEEIQQLTQSASPTLQILNEITNVFEQEMNDYAVDINERLTENQNGLSQVFLDVMKIAKEAEIITSNARVIAARSGESGKQFDVVATELQRLSSQINSLARVAISRIELEQALVGTAEAAQ
jgi:methyl-accepting chemotaxis protein